MNWQFCNSQGVICEDPTNFQVDTVGNIVQARGGVKPLACQKCSAKFATTKEEVPVINKVPTYKCTNCSFQKSSGDAAFDHYLVEPTHKITKVTVDRIIKYETIITGNKPIINVTKNGTNTDVSILCPTCSGA